MKLREWTEHWLQFIKPTVKDRTLVRYSQPMKMHVLPIVGDIEMDEITAEMLQGVVRDLYTEKKLSASSTNVIINVLKNCFSTALEMGVIKSDPAVKLIRPPMSEKSVDCFTLKEQKKIEKAVFEKKYERFGILLALYTGLRLGELLALEWTDVDFKQRTISVNKTCYDTRDGRVIYPPKTKSAVRVIPVPKPVMWELMDLRARAKTKYVIEKKGDYVGIRAYQQMFAQLQKKLKLPHRGFHALRHTFATRAIESGMDITTLAEIMGHRSASITLSRYTHSMTEHKVEMMELMNKFMKDGLRKKCTKKPKKKKE